MRQTTTLLMALSMLFIACQVEENDDLLAQYAKTKTEAADGASCETAFAFNEDGDATCFREDGFRRWGWTNGGLTPGEYVFNMYAGAGQCMTEKGVLVGAVTVNYQVSGEVTVRFVITDGLYALHETHLYVGNNPYPMKKGKATVAPGQFPYKNKLIGTVEDVYELSGFSGELYVIAHAVTCNDGDGSVGQVTSTDDDPPADDYPWIPQ
jgi:hypothetical protein